MNEYAEISQDELEAQREVLFPDASLVLGKIAPNQGHAAIKTVAQFWMKWPHRDYATRESQWLFEIAEQDGLTAADVRAASTLTTEGVRYEILGKGYPNGVSRKFTLFTRQIGTVV